MSLSLLFNPGGQYLKIQIFKVDECNLSMVFKITGNEFNHVKLSCSRFNPMKSFLA